MPWFKVDDGFAFHPKALRAGNAACGLWVRAGSWCMQQLTDGFIPDHVLPTLGTVREAQKLVEAGLWVRGVNGYMFHEWEIRQPTREQVEKERAANAERQRKAREKALRQQSRPDTEDGAA